MKTLSFLAASVALLSSLAVAAPVDAKREDLHSENTLRAFEKKDNTFSDETREEDIYTRETLSITGEEKREELYAGAQELYKVALLRAIQKKDGVGAHEKREELYVAPQNLYSKLSLAAKEKE